MKEAQGPLTAFGAQDPVKFRSCRVWGWEWAAAGGYWREAATQQKNPGLPQRAWRDFPQREEKQGRNSTSEGFKAGATGYLVISCPSWMPDETLLLLAGTKCQYHLS